MGNEKKYPQLSSCGASSIRPLPNEYNRCLDQASLSRAPLNRFALFDIAYDGALHPSVHQHVGHTRLPNVELGLFIFNKMKRFHVTSFFFTKYVERSTNRPTTSREVAGTVCDRFVRETDFLFENEK